MKAAPSWTSTCSRSASWHLGGAARPPRYSAPTSEASWVRASCLTLTLTRTLILTLAPALTLALTHTLTLTLTPTPTPTLSLILTLTLTQTLTQTLTPAALARIVPRVRPSDVGARRV